MQWKLLESGRGFPQREWKFPKILKKQRYWPRDEGLEVNIFF